MAEENNVKKKLLEGPGTIKKAYGRGNRIQRHSDTQGSESSNVAGRSQNQSQSTRRKPKR